MADPNRRYRRSWHALCVYTQLDIVDHTEKSLFRQYSALETGIIRIIANTFKTTKYACIFETITTNTGLKETFLKRWGVRVLFDVFEWGSLV